MAIENCNCNPTFSWTRNGKRRSDGRVWVFHGKRCPAKRATNKQ